MLTKSSLFDRFSIVQTIAQRAAIHGYGRKDVKIRYVATRMEIRGFGLFLQSKRADVSRRNGSIAACEIGL